MDPQTIALVQDSWRRVLPMGAAVGDLFYQHLFEADPTLKPLFQGNLHQQAFKLIQMIDGAVGQLGDLDTLVPVLQQLGQRHLGYGVQAAHYDTVGAALLKTLEQGLGSSCTPDTRAAWTAVYGVMADVMQTPAPS